MKGWQRAVYGIWFLGVALLVLDALQRGRYPLAIVYLAVLVAVVLLLRRRLLAPGPTEEPTVRRSRRRAQAVTTASGWTPERVAATLADVEPVLPTRIRALREADPSLTLAQASALLRQHQP